MVFFPYKIKLCGSQQDAIFASESICQNSGDVCAEIGYYWHFRGTDHYSGSAAKTHWIN